MEIFFSVVLTSSLHLSIFKLFKTFYMSEKIGLNNLHEAIKKEDIPAFLKIIRTPIYRLSDLINIGISKSLFYQWQSEDLVFFTSDNEDSKQWKMFSLFDCSRRFCMVPFLVFVGWVIVQRCYVTC